MDNQHMDNLSLFLSNSSFQINIFFFFGKSSITSISVLLKLMPYVSQDAGHLPHKMTKVPVFIEAGHGSQGQRLPPLSPTTLVYAMRNTAGRINISCSNSILSHCSFYHICPAKLTQLTFNFHNTLTKQVHPGEKSLLQSHVPPKPILPGFVSSLVSRHHAHALSWRWRTAASHMKVPTSDFWPHTNCALQAYKINNRQTLLQSPLGCAVPCSDGFACQVPERHKEAVGHSVQLSMSSEHALSFYIDSVSF